MRFTLGFLLFVACEPTRMAGVITDDAWLDLVVAQGRAELARGHNLGATGSVGPSAPVAEDPEQAIRWVFRGLNGDELASGLAPDTREVFAEGDGSSPSALGQAASSVITVRVPDVDGTFAFYELDNQEIATLRYHPLQGRPFRADLGDGKADFSFETDLLGGLVRLNGQEGQRGFTLLLVPEGFTEAEMDDYHAAATAMVSTLLATNDYAPYRDSLHIFRQDIRSKESGLSDPVENLKRDTAFNVTFGDGRQLVRRCTMPSNDWNATSVANLRTLRQQANADVVVIVTNTDEHSGCARRGEKLIVQPGGRTGRILGHELGHALFGLADEYTEGGRNCVTSAPNLTASTTRSAIPWSDLILPATELPTTDTRAGVVGAFLGGGYCSRGVYRPAHRCMMNNYADEMCPVCAREMTTAFSRRTASVTRAEITNRTPWKIYLLCGAEIGGACTSWVSVDPGATRILQLQDGVFRLSGPPWGERVFVAPSDYFVIYANEDPFRAPSDASVDAGVRDASIEDASSDASMRDASSMDGGSMGECSLVISEVQTAGASADDEFIELFNPCTTAVALDGMTLVYRSRASDSNTQLLALRGSLATGSHFVAGGRGFSGTVQGLLASGLSASGGAVAILRNNDRVDSVGWGNATNSFVENTPASAPQSRGSIARIPDGQDTQNNATDFVNRSMSSPGARNE